MGVDMAVVVADTVAVVVDMVVGVVDMVVGVVVTAVEDMVVVMVWQLAMSMKQQILPMSMPRNCSTVVAEVEEEDTEVVVAAVEDMVVGDMAVAVEEDMAVEEVVGDMVVDTRK
jgi:hypothetical protein